MRKIIAIIAIGVVVWIIIQFMPSIVDSLSADSGTDNNQPPPVTCTLGANQVDVQVQITNSVPCGQEIQTFASMGLTWFTIPGLAPIGSNGTADGETISLICTLYKGNSVMTVEDAGGADYGNQICSSNEQGGWIPQN
jgi:hypothetical protein